MRPAVALPPSEEKVAAFRAMVHERGGTEEDVQRALEPGEVWRNHKYTVHVDRYEDGAVSVLSIKRNDRSPVHDWRDLQRIKNEIAGPEAEAVELYPAQSRLLDTANQYWLWCTRPGDRFPLGYDLDEPTVATAAQAAAVGARQRDGAL
jgi:hypothetical protein